MTLAKLILMAWHFSILLIIDYLHHGPVDFKDTLFNLPSLLSVYAGSILFPPLFAMPHICNVHS
ncbi:hypothetical protein C8R30_10432 [Nitrosomonas nitrosa]|uniref:Uncharacterized protein n=1 Tax=Nitrosomonas nitrosa TaxID=52442 RepID=A0A1I4PP95_9PROT|nr:hypothetical protein C8R30_10432 [Nitrosomonas nitrosa]SFM29731.1 hypothetical protein SAMN05421880_11224 [Nitrosomonas nitrosa]